MGRTRKLLMTVFAILLVALLIISCGPEPAPAPSPAPSPTPSPAPSPAPTPAPTKPITLRYSGGLAPTANISQDQKWWGEQVTERTEGRVVVEVYQGGELYSHREQADAVITGAVDMALCSVGEGWPAKSVFFEGTQLWFLLQTTEQVRTNADELRTLIFPIFEKAGVKPLHWWCHGQGGILSKKPIKKMADMQGKVIRAPTVGDWESLKALGATAARIPAAEVYDAFVKGAIDGVRSGYDSFVTRKWYEQADYMIGTTQSSVWVAFINPKVWDSIPKDLQDIIMEVSREAEPRNFEKSLGSDKAALELLTKELDCYFFTPEDYKSWQAPMGAVYDDWLLRCEQAGYGDEARRFFNLFTR